MLVSLNWLKEYVKIEQDPKTFGDILTMSGTKVETIDPVSMRFPVSSLVKLLKLKNILTLTSWLSARLMWQLHRH